MFSTGSYYYVAENLAYDTGSSFNFPTGPHDLFYQWLYESGDVTTCDSTSKNGHLLNLISANYADMLYITNAIGVGYGAKKTGSRYYLHGTQDFAMFLPIKYSHPLTAGSHYYSDSKTLHFKTHYYSSTPVNSVKLSINGECVDLEKTVGTNTNGVYGTTSIPAPEKCTPYFFEAKDNSGNIIRYPGSGSLLFTLDTTNMNCDNKSWQSEAGSSCYSDGPKCTESQHLNAAGDGCEDDSTSNCGYHGMMKKPQFLNVAANSIHTMNHVKTTAYSIAENMVTTVQSLLKTGPTAAALTVHALYPLV